MSQRKYFLFGLNFIGYLIETGLYQGDQVKVEDLRRLTTDRLFH